MMRSRFGTPTLEATNLPVTLTPTRGGELFESWNLETSQVIVVGCLPPVLVADRLV